MLNFYLKIGPLSSIFIRINFLIQSLYHSFYSIQVNRLQNPVQLYHSLARKVWESKQREKITRLPPNFSNLRPKCSIYNLLFFMVRSVICLASTSSAVGGWTLVPVAGGLHFLSRLYFNKVENNLL